MDILNRKKIAPNQESIAELRRQSARIEQANSALGQRDKVLFEMVRKAVECNDNERATMYANELGRVRHIKKILGQSQLAIDCIMIRIENFLDLCSVVEEMKPISEVIRGVSSEVQDVMPQFSTVLEQLNEVAGEALIETGVNPSQPLLDDALNATSEGGAEILGEVSGMVEVSLRDSFPEPPLVELSRKAEAVGYGGEDDAVQDASGNIFELADAVRGRRRTGREALA